MRPQFWVRKMGMVWGPRGVASPVTVVVSFAERSVSLNSPALQRMYSSCNSAEQQFQFESGHLNRCVAALHCFRAADLFLVSSCGESAKLLVTK